MLNISADDSNLGFLENMVRVGGRAQNRGGSGQSSAHTYCAPDTQLGRQH